MRLPHIDDMFPFGKAAFIILVVTVLAGAWLLVHPVKETAATLSMWVFADTHYNAYEKSLPEFERNHPGTTVNIELVQMQALSNRFRAALWADLEVPDLIESEISFAGSFFRGPIKDIGFMNLKPWLESTGLYDQIVKSRFAPYSHRGRIYGLPHDVHPVMLAYRRDLFEELGIEPTEIQTWDDFIRIGRRVTKLNERYMIEMSGRSPFQFEAILFQRGGGYVDKEGNLIMDNELAVETLTWYIPLVAGADRIGSDLGAERIFTQALEQGYFLCFFCPDWRSKFTEVQVPRVKGKMALMPLPAFEPGGRRTTTMGGTMLGITKKTEHPEPALDLAQHLYMNTEDLAERFKETNIIPPVKTAWKHPAFKECNEYWSNQRLGMLYADLAEEVPPQYASPFVRPAKQKLGEAISACSTYYKNHGDEGFEEYVRKRLKQAADDVRTLMRRNPY